MNVGACVRDFFGGVVEMREWIIDRWSRWSLIVDRWVCKGPKQDISIKIGQIDQWNWILNFKWIWNDFQMNLKWFLKWFWNDFWNDFESFFYMNFEDHFETILKLFRNDMLNEWWMWMWMSHLQKMSIGWWVGCLQSICRSRQKERHIVLKFDLTFRGKMSHN